MIETQLLFLWILRSAWRAAAGSASPAVVGWRGGLPFVVVKLANSAEMDQKGGNFDGKPSTIMSKNDGQQE